MLWRHCGIVRAHAYTHYGAQEEIPNRGSEGFMTYVSLYPKAQKTFQGVPRRKGSRLGPYQRDDAREEKKEMGVGTVDEQDKKVENRKITV